MVTTFAISPKELLVLEDNDCLVCDIKSSQGFEYRESSWKALIGTVSRSS